MQIQWIVYIFIGVKELLIFLLKLNFHFIPQTNLPFFDTLYFSLLRMGHEVSWGGSHLSADATEERLHCQIWQSTTPPSVRCPPPPPALGQVYAPSSLCWSFWVSVVWLPLPLLSNAWTGLLFRWWLRLLRNLRCGSPFRTFWYSYFGGPFLCSVHSWHFDCVLSQIHVLRHGILHLMLYLLSSYLWIYSLMVQNCRVLEWFRDHPITGSALSHSRRSWE